MSQARSSRVRKRNDGLIECAGGLFNSVMKTNIYGTMRERTYGFLTASYPASVARTSAASTVRAPSPAARAFAPAKFATVTIAAASRTATAPARQALERAFADRRCARLPPALTSIPAKRATSTAIATIRAHRRATWPRTPVWLIPARTNRFVPARLRAATASRMHAWLRWWSRNGGGTRLRNVRSTLLFGEWSTRLVQDEQRLRRRTRGPDLRSGERRVRHQLP